MATRRRVALHGRQGGDAGKSWSDKHREGIDRAAEDIKTGESIDSVTNKPESLEMEQEQERAEPDALKVITFPGIRLVVVLAA